MKFCNKSVCSTARERRCMQPLPLPLTHKNQLSFSSIHLFPLYCSEQTTLKFLKLFRYTLICQMWEKFEGRCFISAVLCFILSDVCISVVLIVYSLVYRLLWQQSRCFWVVSVSVRVFNCFGREPLNSLILTCGAKLLAKQSTGWKPRGLCILILREIKRLKLSSLHAFIIESRVLIFVTIVFWMTSLFNVH